MKKKVVIIGAGFGGLAAARVFRDAPVEVTLVDKTNHHLFQPLLYQVATSGLNPSEIASPIRGIFRRQKNLTTLMAEMTGIDYEQKTVELDKGALRVDYDYLILAAGGATSYFGNDSWAEYAPGLKSLEDALHIRQKILYALEQAEKATCEKARQQLMTIVVVGGGPTGVELAGSIAELRRHVLKSDFRKINPEEVRVVLVEAGPHLLTMFPEHLSKYTARELAQMGVEVHLDEPVKEVTQHKVVTSKNTFEAASVIWAAGVGGHPLSERLAQDRDRAQRLMVEADLRLRGHEHVYCIGDMAHYSHGHTFGGRMVPGVAPAAMQQGKRAGKNILRQLKGKNPKPFRYFDKGTMATIGRSSAVAQLPAPLSIGFSGFIAWVAWLFVHLMYLVDYTNRFFVFLRWGWKYLSWKWKVRLITKAPR